MTKNTPTRTCIKTREKLPQSELIRIVRVKNPDGSFSVVIGDQKTFGRSVYLKKGVKLNEKFFLKGAIEGRLKLGRKMSEEEVGRIRNLICL